MAAVPVLLALYSCSLADRDLPLPAEPQHEVTVKLEPSVAALTESKSSYNVREFQISDVTVMAYRDGLLCGSVWSDDPEGGLVLTLVTGLDYHLYTVANTGAAFDAPTREDDLQSCRLAVDYALMESLGIPMSSSCCTVAVSGDSMSVPIELRRLFARVTFGAEESPGGGASFSFNSVRLRQVANSVLPFADGSRASVPSDVSDGDALSAADLQAVNAGGTAVFYVPENMQGTLLETNSDPWQKVPDRIGGLGGLCTYVEAASDYSGSSMTGSVVFRFYLGMDNCRNFDICRNTGYNVTLIPGNDPGSVSSWKLDADLSAAVSLALVKTDASSDDYVGYPQTFVVQGLQSGETVSSVVVNGASEVTHPVLSGTLVRYVPYYTWQLLKVTTSNGRVYQTVVTAKMPAVKAPEYLDLSADGTSVRPVVCYMDASTGETLTGFDNAFYESYLKTKTITLANSCTGLIAGNDYLKLTSGTFSFSSAVDGSGATADGSVFAYRVNVSGWSYGTQVATLTIKNATFAAITAATVKVRILPPLSNYPVRYFGQINDWSMIPPCGDMDLSYVSAKGFSMVNSLDVDWSLPESSLTVDRSNLLGPYISSGTVSDLQVGTDGYSFKITTDHSYSRPSVYFDVRNTKAGVNSCNKVQIGYVSGCLHLSVGAVRTAVVTAGANSSRWMAGASFAKPSGGLSGFASVVAGAFSGGGSYQKCVYVKGAGPVVSYLAGPSGVRVTLMTEESVYGVNAPLYSYLYENISGYASYISSHYEEQAPYITLYEYRSDGYLGAEASGPIEYAGSGVYIHNYKDIYPASGGWLTSATAVYQIAY